VSAAAHLLPTDILMLPHIRGRSVHVQAAEMAPAGGRLSHLSIYWNPSTRSLLLHTFRQCSGRGELNVIILGGAFSGWVNG